MIGSFVTPLAPALILLVGAVILATVPDRLLDGAAARKKVREYGGPAVVGVALFSLLGLRLTYGRDSLGEGLELLSGWNFSTTESVAALMARADGLSLACLILSLLLLLIVTWLGSESSTGETDQELRQRQSGWLLMGAGSCLLFVSGNGLTVVYGVVLFDIIVACHWLWRGNLDLGVARLLLGLVTSAGMMVATLTPDSGPMSGLILLGLALWLRIGLYPFVEATAQRHWPNNDRLAYLGLTLTVGFYLAIRLIDEPLPSLVLWLSAGTMVMSGLLTWLTGSLAGGSLDKRLQLLVWLFLTESLLILVARPLDVGLTIAFSVGLVLSLVALWVTPALGPPRLSEAAWSWPYWPPIFATYTVVGLPLSLGWLARVAIYRVLIDAADWGILFLIIAAEALALSGLVRYWFTLWQGNEISSRRSTAGIVASVPFLTPALGPFVLAAITRTDLSLTRLEPSSATWPVMIVLIVAAFGLDYFRDWLINRFAIPVGSILEPVQPRWLLRWCGSQLDRFGKVVLRIRVTLEGRHYLGWAFLAALVGALVILLQ